MAVIPAPVPAAGRALRIPDGCGAGGGAFLSISFAAELGPASMSASRIASLFVLCCFVAERRLAAAANGWSGEGNGLEPWR
jgi:hypothetical protein